MKIQQGLKRTFMYVALALCMLVGIVRGRKPIIPSGNDMILPGDRVIVLAAGHTLCDLSDIIE